MPQETYQHPFWFLNNKNLKNKFMRLTHNPKLVPQDSRPRNVKNNIKNRVKMQKW